MPFRTPQIPEAGGQGYIPKIPLPDQTIYAPKKPLKFPFEGREIPELPEGMTLPPRGTTPGHTMPELRPPWLGPAPGPHNQGSNPLLEGIPPRQQEGEGRWDFQEPYIDRDEQLRRDFQEKMFSPPPPIS